MKILDTSSDSKALLAELGAVIVLILMTVLPFAPALSSGHTLSKLNLINEIDYLQRGDLDGYIEISSDPSASICHAPNEIYESKNSNGFPLWNTDSGCGRPVIGDFQTLLFSIFHRYFPVGENGYSTAGILVKIWLSSLGAYLLARICRVSRMSSLACGLAFALSPRCLLFAELCNNYCFYPWMLAAALWASSRVNIHRSVLFALAIGACAYNMHPETFVIGAGAAFVLAFLQTAFNPDNHSFAKLPSSSKVLKAAGWTSSLALLSFLIAAPLVIPFCEFILNGVSYKFDTGVAGANHVDFVDIFSYFSNLSVPLFAGSPCIGPVLSLLCLPGLFFAWKKHKALVAIFVTSLMFSCRPGVLESWLSVKPISYLLPEYTIYLVILLSCVFGAFGLDGFVSAGARQVSILSKRSIAIGGLLMMLFIGGLWLVQSPWFCEFWSDKTDWGYSTQATDGTFSVLGLVLMTLVVFLSFARPEHVQRFRQPLAVLFLLANFMPLFLYSSLVLPPNKSFWYKQDRVVSQLKLLQKDNSFRSTATGCFIFQPNTNLIFGTSDFRSTAPLHPRRYANFIKLAGVTSKYCNIYESPSELNQLYDLASVRYVLSNNPVHSSSATLKSQELGAAQVYSLEQARKLVPGIRLEKARIEYFASSHEVRGKVYLTVHEHASRHNIYRIVLVDEHGSRLWPSPVILEPLENFARRTGEHSWVLPIDAPLPAKYKGKFEVTLQVGQYINGQIKGPPVSLATINSQYFAETPEQGRIVRAADSGNYLQIYENRNAFAPAYLVHKIIKAKDETQSLETLSRKDLTLADAAIIEGQNLTDLPPARAQLDKPGQAELARIVDKESDSVSIYAFTKSPAYLILTDTFYPGWQAYVDGKAAQIYPANYAFRAVYLPNAGKHSISYRYDPPSYKLGCNLLFAGLFAAFVLLVLAAFRNGINENEILEEKQIEPQSIEKSPNEHVSVS